MFRFNLPHNVNIIGVCDGHGLNGHYVSSFISDKLMSNQWFYRETTLKRSWKVPKSPLTWRRSERRFMPTQITS